MESSAETMRLGGGGKREMGRNMLGRLLGSVWLIVMSAIPSWHVAFDLFGFCFGF